MPQLQWTDRDTWCPIIWQQHPMSWMPFEFGWELCHPLAPMEVRFERSRTYMNQVDNIPLTLLMDVKWGVGSLSTLLILAKKQGVRRQGVTWPLSCDYKDIAKWPIAIFWGDVYVSMSPLFPPHLEDSSAPIISTKITSCCFKAIPLLFHPPCKQRKRGQMFFTLSDLAVIYVYPVLYTASSQSPSCHHSKQVFSSVMHMRKTGMTRTAPGSSGARQLNVSVRKDKSTIKSKWSGWPLWHPQCNMPWTEVGLHGQVLSETSPNSFPRGALQCQVLLYSRHPGFGGGSGTHLEAASQAWFVDHVVFVDISCVMSCKGKPFLSVASACPINNMCLVKASFYFIYSSVMNNFLLIFTVFFWC